MTIRESLLGVSAYPIPIFAIEAISLKRKVALDDNYGAEIAASKEYRLALADVYKWLYFAPNVGQGGQSYSFTAEQRDLWKKLAMGIYGEIGDDSDMAGLKSTYGYMGHRL